MTIQRWKPGRGLVTGWSPMETIEDMERRVEDLLGREFPAVWRRLPIGGKEWMPAIEVFDRKDKLVVKAELPGMKEEDIDVSVTGDVLTIKGERKLESEIREEDYYHCERSYGSFQRSMTLPSHVNADKIEAKYEDGILQIDLPKTPEIKPKKVKVSSKKEGKAVK